jgi:hypothetical protein
MSFLRKKMGWTHYWQREIELAAGPFEVAVADCKMVLKALDANLLL